MNENFKVKSRPAVANSTVIMNLLHFIVIIIIGGVGLSPWYCGHFWPIVQTPDDR
jgi:hypothetical protein